jgi:hypothetical protein
MQGQGQGQRHGAQDSRARAENGIKDGAIKDGAIKDRIARN